jgi:hypothetical protein
MPSTPQSLPSTQSVFILLFPHPSSACPSHLLTSPCPQYTYCVSWFFGTVVSFTLYVSLCKLFPPHQSFIDEGKPSTVEFVEDSHSELKVDEEMAYVVPASHR